MILVLLLVLEYIKYIIMPFYVLHPVVYDYQWYCGCQHNKWVHYSKMIGTFII
jgi:hypothetical protein